jgi:hypothetical protein
MSENLPVPAGGGAVVPATTGGAVGEHVADVSIETASPQGDGGLLLQDLQGATGLGLALGPTQYAKASEVLVRHRLAEDQRQKAAAVKAMRAEWGSTTYDRRISRIHEWLNILPEGLSEVILDARDGTTGVPICSKPDVLRAMYEIARNFPVASDDERDKAAAERELQAEWKGAYHSHIFSLKSYLDTLPQSAQEGILDARDSVGVAILNRPEVLKWLLQLARPRLMPPQGGPSPDPSAARIARLREIQGWMGARKGSAEYKKYYDDPKVQTEYRDLVDQGATGDGTAKVADSAIDQRIAEIDRWMGSRKGSADYKRYWDDPMIQREYSELLERRGGKR